MTHPRTAESRAQASSVTLAKRRVQARSKVRRLIHTWARRSQLRGVQCEHDLEVDRTAIFQGSGVQLGSRVRIGPLSIVKGPARVGDGTLISAGAWITPGTSIGAGCSIGPYVRFVTGSHDIGAPEHRAGPTTRDPVSIGDGVWIGINVIVMPGVNIGRGPSSAQDRW